MLRTKLRNQFIKSKTHEQRVKYNKQINIFVSISRKPNRSYPENPDLEHRTYNKKFWVTVTSLFQ